MSYHNIQIETICRMPEHPEHWLQRWNNIYCCTNIEINSKHLSPRPPLSMPFFFMWDRLCPDQTLAGRVCWIRTLVNDIIIMRGYLLNKGIITNSQLLCEAPLRCLLFVGTITGSIGLLKPSNYNIKLFYVFFCCYLRIIIFDRNTPMI
jgi:hypothetical protein